LLAPLAGFGFIAARAVRYRLLLGHGEPRSMRTILAVTLSSWGASLILPGPSGDAAFVMLSRTRLKAPVAVGVGAALLSRLLDVASLLLVALITAPLAGVVLPGALLGGGVVLALLIAVGLTALFWSRSRRIIAGWLEHLALPASLHERLHFAIEELGTGSRPALLVMATLGARVATGLQYLALFAAIDQPLSLVQVWFALSIRTLLQAVPIQGVGGLGTMQLWWTAGLTLLGWPAQAGIAEIVRLQAEVEQLLVLGVVVVLFALHPRVRQVDDAGLEPVGRPRIADLGRQRLDRELLGELVEDAVLAPGSRMLEGQSHAG